MGIPATWSGFSTVECYRCGTGFAMENGLYERRQRDHESFWCPNGHSQCFTGLSTEKERIAELERAVAAEKERADSAQRQRSWAEARAKGANISAGLARASARRLRARVDKGVCPDCHRTFKQLAAHMKCKHGK